MDLLACSISRYLINSRFMTIESIALSDLVSNNDNSNFSSNSRSSRYSKTARHEWDLNRGITGLSQRRIIEIRFVFSYTGGGSGSGFSLVCRLEASVLNYSQKSNGQNQLV